MSASEGEREEAYQPSKNVVFSHSYLKCVVVDELCGLDVNGEKDGVGIVDGFPHYPQLLVDAIWCQTEVCFRGDKWI